MFFKTNDVKEIKVSSRKELNESFKELSDSTECEVLRLELLVCFNIPDRIVDTLNVSLTDDYIVYYKNGYKIKFEFDKKYSIEKYIELIRFVDCLNNENVSQHVDRISELKDEFVKIKDELIIELKNIVNKSIIDPEIETILITRINQSTVKFMVLTSQGLKVVFSKHKNFSVETNKMFQLISDLMNGSELNSLNMSFEIYNKVGN